MSDQNRFHLLKNRNEVQDVLVFAENALMMTSDDDVSFILSLIANGGSLQHSID